MTQSERNQLIRRMLLNSCRLFFLAHMGGYGELNDYSPRVLLSREPHHVSADPETGSLTIQNEQGQPEAMDDEMPPSKEYVLALMEELSTDIEGLRALFQKQGLRPSKRPALMKRSEWNHLIATDQMIAAYFSWPALVSDPEDVNTWYV